MKNNENVKQRKSFKEVVAENKEVILAASMLVATGAGVVLLGRYVNHTDLKLKVSQLESWLKLETGRRESLEARVETAENIIVNSGIIEKAKATLTQKRDNLVGKLICLNNSGQINEAIVDSIKEGIAEFDDLLLQIENVELDVVYRTLGDGLSDK